MSRYGALLLLMGGVALHAAVVSCRAVNFDEHVHLYLSWLRAIGEVNGAGFHASHPSLSIEVVQLALGPSPDPVTSLTWARLFALVIAFAQAAVLYLWARRAAPSTALWAPGLFLTADVITYSISELRVDAVASIWTIAAWVLLARGGPPWIAGLMLGMPGTENQKHVLVLAAGVFYLWRMEGWRSATIAAIAGSLPVAAQLGGAAWNGVLAAYWERQYGIIGAVAGHSDIRQNLLLVRDVAITAPHLLFLSLGVLGAGCRDFLAGSRSDESLILTAAGCGFLFIVTAPYPNQYNLLPLVAALVVAACRGAEGLLATRTGKRRVTVAGLLGLHVVVFHGWLPLNDNLFILRSNEAEDQRAETTRRHSLIPPAESYFDGAGLAFRRSPLPFWHMTLSIHAAMRAMPELLPDIPRGLIEKRCRFVALNDFTTELPAPVVAFLKKNYIPLWKDLHVLGIRIGETGTGHFDVVIPGRYRREGGAGDLVVDGVTWSGDRALDAGTHSFSRTEPTGALDLVGVGQSGG